MASLDGHPEFEVVMGWLEESLADLMSANCHAKDEVLMRWQQGACQALSDLVHRARSARETQYSRKR